MPTEDPFSEIEIVKHDGMIFASVFDLVMWLKEMGDNNSNYTESDRKIFLFIIQSLTRLVEK